MNYYHTQQHSKTADNDLFINQQNMSCSITHTSRWHISGDKNLLDATSKSADDGGPLFNTQLTTEQCNSMAIFCHLLTQPRSSTLCLSTEQMYITILQYYSLYASVLLTPVTTWVNHINTRLPSNLRQNHPQMCAFSYTWSFLVMSQRRRLRHSICCAQNPMLHANITALCFIEPELLPIEVLHCGNGNFRSFGSCGLDLDPMIFIYKTDS